MAADIVQEITAEAPCQMPLLSFSTQSRYGSSVRLTKWIDLKWVLVSFPPLDFAQPHQLT